MLDHKLVDTIIGKTFADKLDSDVFAVHNQWYYTRREMVEQLGCANFIAAVKLAKVLKRLKVTSPKQLFELDPISLARSKGIGESAMFVAMCILDSSGYSVEEWWGWHNDIGLKFSSFKHHAMKRANRNGKHEV